MKKRELRVLFLPADDGGCGWYRIRTWHEQFEKRKDVESYIMTGKEDNQLELINKSDIIVGRLGAAAYIRELKTNIDPKKPVVFDHDDNTFEVLPTSEHYREFGTQDAYVKYEDGTVKPVWISGETKGFNSYKNLWGQMGLIYNLSVADLITTPVARLTQYFMEYAKDGAIGGVVPNSLDFGMYPEGEFEPKDKKKGEIRLGWQGGVSHLGTGRRSTAN